MTNIDEFDTSWESLLGRAQRADRDIGTYDALLRVRVIEAKWLTTDTTALRIVEGLVGVVARLLRTNAYLEDQLRRRAGAAVPEAQ
jgi:hypothetical protein